MTETASKRKQLKTAREGAQKKDPPEKFDEPQAEISYEKWIMCAAFGDNCAWEDWN